MTDETRKPSPLERLLGAVKDNVPILGGLAGDGARTSGFAILTAAGTVLATIPDLSPTVRAICLTGLAAVWILAGALKRPA